MIDIQDVRCLMEVAREKNITKAAANLFLTQSAVSQRITRIEQELNLTIFTRTKRFVELTDEGHIFMSYAAQIIDSWEQFLKKTEKLALNTAQFITVGLHALAIYSDFPDLISRFTTAYPHWKVNLSTHNTDYYARLSSGELDFFFLTINQIESYIKPGLTCIPLKEDNLYVLLHKSDLLSAKDLIEEPDLTGYHLLSWNTELLDASPKELGLTLTICDDSALPMMITAPGSFALAPKSYCTKILSQHSHLIAKPFDADTLNLYMIYRENPDFENHPFVQFVTEYYKQQ